MGRSEIDNELLMELRSAAAEADCRLLEARFARGLLRLTLDRDEGVTLEDCERVSRRVSALLDVADFGSGKYTLEVSSPGLDRKLYGPEDYPRYLGSRLRVTWRDPETDRKQTFVGELTGFEPEQGGSAHLLDSDSGQRYTILLKNIELARLEPDFGS